MPNKETETADTATGNNASSGKPAHILVVEDDTFMSRLLSMKLSAENFAISTALNVQEARGILEKNPISLILLDIILPGTDGLSFLKELKQNPQLKAIPVIITSNLGQAEEVESGLKEGAVDYLVKANTTPGEILEKIKQILSKQK